MKHWPSRFSLISLDSLRSDSDYKMQGDMQHFFKTSSFLTSIARLRFLTFLPFQGGVISCQTYIFHLLRLSPERLSICSMSQFVCNHRQKVPS